MARWRQIKPILLNVDTRINGRKRIIAAIAESRASDETRKQVIVGIIVGKPKSQYNQMALKWRIIGEMDSDAEMKYSCDFSTCSVR